MRSGLAVCRCRPNEQDLAGDRCAVIGGGEIRFRE